MESVQSLAPKKRAVWCDAFLAAYRESGNVRLAAEAAGIDRNTAYAYRSVHDDFREEWESAKEDAADRLEQEALRRAHDGVKRQKFHQGSPIMTPAVGPDGFPIKDEKGEYILVPYYEHEYSDTLMIFLLKGIRPEKYRENMKIDMGEAKPLHVTEVIVSTREEAEAVLRLNES